MAHTKKRYDAIAFTMNLLAILSALLSVAFLIATLDEVVIYFAGGDYTLLPAFGLLFIFPLIYFTKQTNKYLEKVLHLESIVPDEELIEFADKFSRNFMLFSPGTYLSSNSKYKIIYSLDTEFVPAIPMDVPGVFPKRKPYFSGRINMYKDIIEICKRDILESEMSVDGVFYLIVWLAMRRKCHDVFEADIKTMKWYLTTGRSVKKTVIDQIKIFKNNPDIYIHREKKIMKFLESYSD